ENLDVSFYIYTTDSYWPFSGDKPSFIRENRSVWPDGSVHLDGAQPPLGPGQYTFSARYELNTPHNTAAELSFSSGMAPALFEERAAALEEAVRAIGIRGTDYESAFCTMAQTIVGLGDNAFLEPQDNVVYVLLSDADDYDGDYWCLATIDATYEVQTHASTTSTTDPDAAIAVQYWVGGYEVTYRYDWTDPETGELRPNGNGGTHRVTEDMDLEGLGIGACPSSHEAPCSPELVAYAE